MFEGVVALFCLIAGVFSGNLQWYIAAGVFAIAANVDAIANRKGE